MISVQYDPDLKASSEWAVDKKTLHRLLDRARGHGLQCVPFPPPDHFEKVLDDLPRDIILCDWHYNPCCEYPTLRYLQDKGFDVLGCPRYHENSYPAYFTRSQWCICGKCQTPLYSYTASADFWRRCAASGRENLSITLPAFSYLLFPIVNFKVW